MRLRFILLAAVSACKIALRAQPPDFEARPLQKVNSATRQTGLVAGTVTFEARRTYQQGSSRIDSAVYAMTL